MRILWVLNNLFSYWAAVFNTGCWSHTKKSAALYVCGGYKNYLILGLETGRGGGAGREIWGRGITITAGERGEYGCILCLPVGITLTPLLFIIKIGLLAPMQGRKGLKCGFIIAPVTIVWETTGSSSYCEFPGTSIMLSFQTVFLFCTISSCIE